MLMIMIIIIIMQCDHGDKDHDNNIHNNHVHQNDEHDTDDHDNLFTSESNVFLNFNRCSGL